MSWVRPKANGGRPGHVSHPLATFLPFDFGNRAKPQVVSKRNHFCTSAAPDTSLVPSEASVWHCPNCGTPR
ncbi:MAG: hypothetical protein DMG35_03050 [Acidobacteria bacterium]|nr:MAG: hypothetical protein DMG35_03050 [Acidobacteriota bacterium]